MKKYGSRAEVWHGNAEMTTGKLKKHNLYFNNELFVVQRK